MRTTRTKVSYRGTPPLRDASSNPQMRSAMPITASAAPASVNAPARRRNRSRLLITRRATKNDPTGSRTASTSTARRPALSPTATAVSRILALKANPRQPTAIESRLDQVLRNVGDGPASTAASTAATNQTRSKVTRDCPPGTRTQGNASTLSGTHSSNAGRSSLWKRSARTTTQAMPTSNPPGGAPWLPTSQPSRSGPASAASHPSRQSTRGRRSARSRPRSRCQSDESPPKSCRVINWRKPEHRAQVLEPRLDREPALFGRRLHRPPGGEGGPQRRNEIAGGGRLAALAQVHQRPHLLRMALGGPPVASQQRLGRSRPPRQRPVVLDPRREPVRGDLDQFLRRSPRGGATVDDGRQGAVGEVDQQRDALRTPAVVRPVDAPSLHPDRSTADQVPGQVDEVAHLAKRAPALAFVEIPVIR